MPLFIQKPEVQRRLVATEMRVKHLVGHLLSCFVPVAEHALEQLCGRLEAAGYTLQRIRLFCQNVRHH